MRFKKCPYRNRDLILTCERVESKVNDASQICVLF